MNKKLASTILFFCLMFGLSNILFAQNYDEALLDEVDLTLNKEIFSSLESIRVAVSFKEAPLFDENAEKQTKVDIETKLKNAGFVIDQNSLTTYLYISAKSEYSGTSLTSFVIEVSFHEKFLLARKQTISEGSNIWNRNAKILPNSIEKNTLRDTVRNLIDKFIAICAKSKDKSITKSVPSKVNTQRISPNNPSQPKKSDDDSPFTATYVGGNSPPEIEIFNDSDRTLYIDLGDIIDLFDDKIRSSENKITAHTVPSKQSIKIQLNEGRYYYKAAALSVKSLEGNENFQKGYRYVWKFRIITVRK